MSGPPARPVRPGSLANALSDQRLAWRERQILRLLAILRVRRGAVDTSGAERAALDRAIRQYGHELSEVRTTRTDATPFCDR